jgi:hypothetical protein
MKKKQLPSKKKYDEKNPSMTFRTNKKNKLELKNMSEAMQKSVSEIIDEYFFDPIHGAVTIWKSGIEYGRNLERENNQIFYFCSVCNNPIIVIPNTHVHHAIIQYMLDHGWGHSECHEKNRQNKQE